MQNRSILLIIAWLVLTGISCNTQTDLSDKKIRETAIEDFLLEKLCRHRILVIPECLSHDSYDAIRLPLSLIKRWTQADHNIKKLFVGLETEVNNHEFESIQNKLYYQQERFATICPPGWGLFSTKKLSEYLFYKEVRDKLSERNLSLFKKKNFQLYPDEEHIANITPEQMMDLCLDEIHTILEIEKVGMAHDLVDKVILDMDIIPTFTYREITERMISDGRFEVIHNQICGLKGTAPLELMAEKLGR